MHNDYYASVAKTVTFFLRGCFHALLLPLYLVSAVYVSAGWVVNWLFGLCVLACERFAAK